KAGEPGWPRPGDLGLSGEGDSRDHPPATQGRPLMRAFRHPALPGACPPGKSLYGLRWRALALFSQWPANVYRASQADRAVLERAGSYQAADRSRIDGIGPSYISHRLARVKPLQRFLALMRSHLAGALKLHASILGTLAALARPGADQLTLE